MTIKLILAALLIPTLAFADTETILCGNCFVNNKAGTVTWTSPELAEADDGSHTSASGKFKGGGFTQWLDCEMGSGNVFSVSGTINGITITVESDELESGPADDDGIHIIKGGTASTTDRSHAVDLWPTSLNTQTWGSTSDLWGETWGASDINAVDFGIRIGIKQVSNDFARPTIDYVQISVDYTPGAVETSHIMHLIIID